MKKLLLIFFTAFWVIPLWAEDAGFGLQGHWIAEPFVMEQDDGLLTAPEAAYAFPYAGISTMDFIDRGFVVFVIGGEKHRAFYEVEELDFDNFHIKCSFKNGEEFLLKLVKVSENQWKYLYRIDESSILRDSSSEEEIPADELLIPGDSPADDMMPVDVEEPEQPAESIYTGILKRK